MAGAGAADHLMSRKGLLSNVLQSAQSSMDAADTAQLQKDLAAAVHAKKEAEQRAAELRSQVMQLQETVVSQQLDLQRVQCAQSVTADTGGGGGIKTNQPAPVAVHLAKSVGPRAVVEQIRTTCDFENLDVPEALKPGLQHLRYTAPHVLAPHAASRQNLSEPQLAIHAQPKSSTHPSTS